MNKLNLNQLKGIIIAGLVLVIGILLCCSLAMGINGLSIVAGIILIIFGILFISNAILIGKNPFTKNGILGIVLFTFGLMFIVHKLAGIIIDFIPLFLIVLGCVIITDAFLGKYSRKDDNLTQFIIKIVIGSIALLLGICLKLIKGFTEYASVILGILLIIYSIYMIFTIFVTKNNNQITE